MPKMPAQWLLILIFLVSVFFRVHQLEATPPGLHYDEAANLILSGDIGLRGERPIFITSYTGKEVLYFYLAGGMAAALGESPFTLRLTSALIGLLTVAVTYRLGVLLLHRRDVALLAAALLALSFWHLVFSRLGFRAITQPLLQGLTTMALFTWLGSQRGPIAWRNPALWLSGLFLGATAYTYLAARLFPIALAVGFLPLFWNRRWRGQLVVKFAPVVGIAAVVLLPLGSFFITHPETFWVRIEQVGQSGAESLTIWEGLGRALLMIGWRGDPYWRFNIPNAPLFNSLWFVLLIMGLFSLVLQILRTRGLRQTGLWLILIAPLIMILPTALATNEILPSNLRAIGMVPFLFLWPALGAVELLAFLYQVSRLGGDQTRRWLWFMAAIIMTFLVFEGGSLYDRFFQEWGQRADLFYENDGDLAAVADYVNQNQPDEAIYVVSRFDQHPTMAALTTGYDELRWLPEGRAIVWPADGEALLIYPHSVPVPDWAADLLGQPELIGAAGPDGEPLFSVYRLSDPPAAVPLDEDEAGNFGFAVRLLGAASGSGTAGQSVPVTLWWHIDDRPQSDLSLFVHLEDQWGYRWSQVELSGYPVRHWTPGERFVTQIAVSLPEGIPPGFYRVKTGWFDPASGQQVARLDPGGRYAGTAFVMNAVPILPATGLGSDLQPPIQLGARVWSDVTLVGVDSLPPSVEAGGQLMTALYWRSEAADLPALAVRYELLRPNRTGIILTDRQPANGTYPFTSWKRPQQVIDRQVHTLPSDLPAGSYVLHLRVQGNDGATLYELDLGAIEVVAAERTFVPPAIEERIDARFGGEIELLGVNRRILPEQNRMIVELVWQAVDRPSADFTVFLHLLDGSEGRCCLWQLDRPPAPPTGRWVDGQVVIDRYEIPLEGLPAGEYPLEVGLYLPESGLRLEMRQGAAAGQDFVYLNPLIINMNGEDN